MIISKETKFRDKIMVLIILSILSSKYNASPGTLMHIYIDFMKFRDAYDKGDMEEAKVLMMIDATINKMGIKD